MHVSGAPGAMHGIMHSCSSQRQVHPVVGRIQLRTSSEQVAHGSSFNGLLAATKPRVTRASAKTIADLMNMFVLALRSLRLLSA